MRKKNDMRSVQEQWWDQTREALARSREQRVVNFIIGVDPAKQAETQQANALALAAGDAQTPPQSADVAPGTRFMAADGSCVGVAPETASRAEPDSGAAHYYPPPLFFAEPDWFVIGYGHPTGSREYWHKVIEQHKPMTETVESVIAALAATHAITSEAALARALFVAMNETEVVRRAEQQLVASLGFPLKPGGASDAKREKTVDTMLADPRYANQREAAERLCVAGVGGEEGDEVSKPSLDMSITPERRDRRTSYGSFDGYDTTGMYDVTMRGHIPEDAYRDLLAWAEKHQAVWALRQAPDRIAQLERRVAELEAKR